MDAEYHKPRVQEIEGDSKQVLGEIAEILFDRATRHVKVELESEGTLYWRGRLSRRC